MEVRNEYRGNVFKQNRFMGNPRKNYLISTMQFITLKRTYVLCPKTQNASVFSLLKWTGVCWCNPPYGRQIGKWVEKAVKSSATVVMLLPARTDTKWFHDWCLPYGKIEFLRGRLKFGGCDNSAPFPSMIVVFEVDKEA